LFTVDDAPRILMPALTEPPTVGTTMTFGALPAMPSILVTFISSSVLWVNADIAIGASCSDCSRFCAVTITSSSAAATAPSGSAAHSDATPMASARGFPGLKTMAIPFVRIVSYRFQATGCAAPAASGRTASRSTASR
jgi:hypothetical protein